MMSIQSNNAQKIAAGGWHSVVVCADSTVKCFGENATGQLGNGTNTDSNAPVAAGTLTGVVAVSGGGDQLEAHSMALKADGTVWAWGSNLYGALGNGNTTNTNTPGQVLLLSNITAISAGGWHSVALKSDSTVWTWGWNSDGQLGDGTTADKTVATQVPGLTDVVAVAAGSYHVLALKSDGTVWAWGDNISGQIGNGNTTDQSAPVQVGNLTNVAKIAAGRFFSLAVKNDGTVWTWGENTYGQLGDSTTTNSSTPVQVKGLNGNVVAAACGAFECHVILSDGNVWAWGRNTYGNIGDNTLTHRSKPVQMQGASDAAGVAAGTNFSLMYKTDGTFWGCGRNQSGQLGDGSFTQPNVLSQSTIICSIVQQPNGIFATDSEDLIAIDAYPNPSNGVFFVEVAIEVSSSNDLLMEVYNTLGERVFHSTQNSAFIDISNQPSGSYFLIVKSAQNNLSKKLMKQ
jgi:alpha-tubulin suppressor-like RCC1 family protein